MGLGSDETMSRDVHTPTIDDAPELGDVGFGVGDEPPPLEDEVGASTLVACSNPHAANARVATRAMLSERDLFIGYKPVSRRTNLTRSIS